MKLKPVMLMTTTGNLLGYSDTMSYWPYKGNQNCWLETIDSNILTLINSYALPNLMALIWAGAFNFSNNKI